MDADRSPTTASAEASRSPGSSATPGTVRVLREPGEIEAVRDAWLALQGDQITVDPDYYAATARSDPRIVRPHLVVLERDGAPAAMLVGRIESLDLATKLGYRTVYAPRVRSLTVVYGGILGDVGEETFRQLLASVRQALADGEADVAIFRYLPRDSLFYRIASTAGPFAARQHVAEYEVHWELTLPESLDDLLKSISSSTRQKINRYARKLEREYGDRLEVRVYTDAAELDLFFAEVETVAAKTYQRALGVAFGNTPSHRERARVCMERGWFRGYVLSVDGRAVAFHQGELYRGRFRHGRPGYDPELGHLRIGTYLLLRLLDDLCRDEESRVVDYGVGDAEYKGRFGTRSWEEGNVFLYAPTARALTINLVRTVLRVGTGWGKRILGRGELARRLKRRWRRSLQQRGRKPGPD